MTVINTNVKALYTQSALKISNRDSQVAMQQLSTGKRINSSKDDAAGLAIAARMNQNIQGLKQSIRNAGDAISMIQTAEGATQEITTMLQRMSELAVQSANSTYSSDQRSYLDQEFQQLKQEIVRVSEVHEWNGFPILNGKAGVPVGTPKVQTMERAAVAAGSTGKVLSAGDLKISIGTQDYAIVASDAADDTKSSVVSTSSSKAGSAIAVAAAINKQLAVTGVSAIANGAVVRGAKTTVGDSSVQTDLYINGITVNLSLTKGQTEAERRSYVMNAVNAKTAQHGVTAGDSGNGGLTLKTVDGRNLSVWYDASLSNGSDFGLGANTQTSSDPDGVTGVASAAVAAGASVVSSTVYGTVTLNSEKEFTINPGVNSYPTDKTTATGNVFKFTAGTGSVDFTYGGKNSSYTATSTGAGTAAAFASALNASAGSKIAFVGGQTILNAGLSTTAAVAATTLVYTVATSGLEVGQLVTGTSIPVGTTISTISDDKRTITLSAAITGADITAAGGGSIVFGGSQDKANSALAATTAIGGTDLVYTAATAGLTVGQLVTGTGIPLGTSISAISTDKKTITLSQATTAAITNAGGTITFGVTAADSVQLVQATGTSAIPLTISANSSANKPTVSSTVVAGTATYATTTQVKPKELNYASLTTLGFTPGAVMAKNVGRLNFQVGPAANQLISIDLSDFGKNGDITGPITSDKAPTNLLTIQSANDVIVNVNKALDGIAATRATMGAVMNRLEHVIDNLTNVVTNSESSRSQIEDADYAQASTELARTQIMQQAATAVLAQANTSQQTVLKLLQG
jgi:flagellin